MVGASLSIYCNLPLIIHLHRNSDSSLHVKYNQKVLSLIRKFIIEKILSVGTNRQAADPKIVDPDPDPTLEKKNGSGSDLTFIF